MDITHIADNEPSRGRLPAAARWVCVGPPPTGHAPMETVSHNGSWSERGALVASPDRGILGFGGGLLGTLAAIDITALVSLTKGWLMVLEPAVVAAGPRWSVSRSEPLPCPGIPSVVGESRGSGCHASWLTCTTVDPVISGSIS
jgi:hypothetical protein